MNPPVEARKQLRSMKERAFFTEREWENWLLFYSVPLLKNILKNKYLSHWALLVQAIHILLQTEISVQMMNAADLLLLEFVGKVEALYGRHMMRYNVHLLLHFVQNVSRHGGLFALSAYASECGNQDLKKMIFASNGIPNQVCRNQSEKLALKTMKLMAVSKKVETFMSSIDKKQKPTSVGKIQLFGKGTSFQSPSPQERWLLSKYKIDVNHCILYTYLKKDGYIFRPRKEVQRLRTDNSIALLKDGSAVKVKKVFHNEMDNKVWVFASKVNCRPSKYCHQAVLNLKRLSLCFLLDVTSIDEELLSIPASSFNRVFVNLNQPHGHSLSPIPNNFNMF